MSGIRGGKVSLYPDLSAFLTALDFVVRDKIMELYDTEEWEKKKQKEQKRKKKEVRNGILLGILAVFVTVGFLILVNLI